MKSKEWFSQLKTQGKISHEDYDKFLESVPDFEVPDNAIKAFESSFLTVDRAAAHPEVSKKIRFDTLNPLDRDLSKIQEVIGAIDPYLARDMQKITKQIGDKHVPDTYKQFEFLTSNLPKIIDKVKVAPDDVEAKKQIEELKKVNEQFTEKFTTFEKQKAEEIKSVRAESEKQFKDFKLGALLEKKASSYTFADGFKDARPILTKAILGDLRSKNHLDFATNEGEEVIGVFDLENGVPRPKFNGNTAVTLDTLLDEAFKPYLKVNGKEAEVQEQTRHQQFRVSDQQQNGKGRSGAPVAASV